MATPATVPLEPHELGTRTHQWCDRCATWQAIEQDYAIVNATTLEAMLRETWLTCACGHTDRWR